MTRWYAQRTPVDGIVFASKAEARRYAELRLLQKAGVISHLKVQPKYALHVLGFKLGTYVGDFEYRERNGDVVTEDVKGVRTPIYRWKAKHFAAEYGRAILETER